MNIVSEKDMLLEAAKNAGYRIFVYQNDIHQYEQLLFVQNGVHWSQWKEWNPLLDDADSFNLQCDMGFSVKYRTANVDVSRGKVSVSEYTPTYKDVKEATRRAITRLAATLNKKVRL